MKTGLTLLIFPILAMASCMQEKSPQDETATDTLTKTQVDSLYQVDTKKSVVTWIANTPAGKHNGTIMIDSGYLGIRNDTIVNAELIIDIPSLIIQNISQGSAAYSEAMHYLMSPRFFAADSFAYGHIIMTDILPINQSGDSTMIEDALHIIRTSTANPTHLARGSLTVRGLTKPVSFPIQIARKNVKITSTGQFSINREDWGLNAIQESEVINKLHEGGNPQELSLGYYLEVSTANR